MWKHGITITHSTPYHPISNSQCERVNRTIWKAVQLALRMQELDNRYWQTILDMALHCIHSLLCTTTNSTPHERLFKFHRRSGSGYTLPDWLQGDLALLRNLYTSLSLIHSWKQWKDSRQLPTLKEYASPMEDSQQYKQVTSLLHHRVNHHTRHLNSRQLCQSTKPSKNEHGMNSSLPQRII